MTRSGSSTSATTRWRTSTRARRLPSLQLVGSPEKRTLDLTHSPTPGVRLVGRFAGVAGARPSSPDRSPTSAPRPTSNSAVCSTASTSTSPARGLDNRRAARSARADRSAEAVTTLDLGQIDTVVWATGFRPNYPWLEPHLLDHKGAIRHDGGVMRHPACTCSACPSPAAASRASSTASAPTPSSSARRSATTSIRRQPESPDLSAYNVDILGG